MQVYLVIYIYVTTETRGKIAKKIILVLLLLKNKMVCFTFIKEQKI